MFRNAGGATDSVSLHVDSGCMTTGLPKKIPGEELFNSYKKAESDGNKGAQGNYFEELMHWCFCQRGTLSAITGFIRPECSGSDGVS